MEARFDEVLGEQTKLAALGKEMSSDFDVDGLPTITPFRQALGGIGGTPVIVAGGYDTENCWEAVDSGVSRACFIT
jgi:thiamine monophosphate synthase